MAQRPVDVRGPVGAAPAFHQDAAGQDAAQAAEGTDSADSETGRAAAARAETQDARAAQGRACCPDAQ